MVAQQIVDLGQRNAALGKPRRFRSSKPSDAHGRCGAPGPTLRAVLDTCILKLATFPARTTHRLVYELARASLFEAWVSPAILEEYADVLGDDET